MSFSFSVTKFVLRISTLALLLSFFAFSNTTVAAPDNLLNYQARITDPAGTPVPDGTFSITFTIYNDPAEGNVLWQETQIIPVQNGIIDARLGLSVPINLDFNTGRYYLGVRIENDSELTPRRTIGAAPFALNASLLDGRPVGTNPNSILALDNNSNLNLPGNITASGAITLGNISTGEDGRIRFTGTDFEGFFDGNWHSLTNGFGLTLNPENTPVSGQILMINNTGSPTFTTITGDISLSSVGVATINPNSVSLGTDTAGDYVANVLSGNGINIANSGGEGSTPTIALGPLTSDFNQTGAFDIILNNPNSEIKIMESVGGMYFITLDAGDLSEDRAIIFGDESGTVCTTGSICNGYAPATGSTTYANRQLSNLTGVAINTSLLPDTNNSHDLGSDALRWADLYLGSSALHIGDSVSSETTLSYDTSTNTLGIGFHGGVAQLSLTDTGNLIQGQGALATTVTDGFPYIASMAGAPTGTPTSYAGRIPFTYDTTGNGLYFYNAGWQLIAGGGVGPVSGSGAAGQVTYWTGPSTTAGSATFLWNNSVRRLSLGTNPAASGIIAIPNGQAIVARNSTNDADIPLIQLNSSNNIQLHNATTGDTNLQVGSTSSTSKILNIANFAQSIFSRPRANVNIEGFLAIHDFDNFDPAIAQSGTIRLANSDGLVSRNAANTDDFRVLELNSNDHIQIGGHTGSVTLQVGSVSTGIGQRNLDIINAAGGANPFASVNIEGFLAVHNHNDLDPAIAQSGTIRLANNDAIVARNSTNNGDFRLIELNSSDHLQIAGHVGSEDVNLQVGSTGTYGNRNLNILNAAGGVNPNVVSVNIEGFLAVHSHNNFDPAIATSGTIRLANSDFITARNNADSGNINILSLNTSDTARIETNLRIGAGTTGCLEDADGTILIGACSSDQSLKTNVVTLSGVLDKVLGIAPVSYNWKPSLENYGTATQYGLIAQQVEGVLPELVTTGNDGLKKIHFNYLPFFTLQALKELDAKFELKVANIESEISALALEMVDIKNEITLVKSDIAGIKDRVTALEEQAFDIFPSATNIAIEEGVEELVIEWENPVIEGNYSVFITPNWITSFAITEKSSNSFKILFGTATPENALIDYKVEK